jgi:hypothetical protein
MKIISIFILLIFGVACVQEEIPSYDDLSQDERDEIDQRSAQKCLDESASDFSEFKTDSNSNLADFTRGDYWKLEYSNGTTTYNNYVYVWKVTASAIYFLYQQTIESTTYHKFIKMTSTFNGEMIDDLRVQKCNVSDPLSVSESASSISVSFQDVETTEGSTDYKTTTTYSTNSNYPAFFASLNKEISKKKLNDDGDVTSTEKFSYKISYVGDDEDVLESSYANYSNMSYCVHNYNPTALKSFDFPFELNCENDGVTNANPSTDATLDFVPSTEL